MCKLKNLKTPNINYFIYLFELIVTHQVYNNSETTGFYFDLDSSKIYTYIRIIIICTLSLLKSKFQKMPIMLLLYF